MQLLTLLHWRLTAMQYIALLCAPMIISLIIFLFQVKSFNEGILLVDSVMTSPCAMCTSGTRHMPSSHCGHLLITTYSTMFCKYILQHLLLYYLEYIFLNWLPYYYILYYYFYFTLIYVLPVLLSCLLITSQERGGCYPGLTSGTHIHDWDLRLTRFLIDRSKLNNRVLIYLSYIPLDITFTLYIIDYTICAFPSGFCR